MPDILARYGPFFLYSYTVVLGAGAALALGLTAVLARRAGVRGWLDGLLFAAAVGLVIGRIVFVRLNAAYFAENPAEAWQFWLGGLNAHGLLLGGLAGFWLWHRLAGRSPPGRIALQAGLLAPGLALLFAAAWAACGIEGCAYGRPAPPGPLAASLPDDFGIYASRYRTQLFGALGSLAVFAVALVATLRRARTSGDSKPLLVFWGTLAGLSLVQAAVAAGRGDPAPDVRAIRLDLLINAGLFFVSLLALVWLFVRTRVERRIIHSSGGTQS